MNLSNIFLFLVVATVTNADSSQVTQITAKTFSKELSSSSKYMIKFYADWCGHCKRLAPTWEEVASELAETYDKDGVKVGKVEGSTERAVSSRFAITGFPTIYFVDGWNVRKYKGSRTKEDLLQFARGGYKNVEPDSFVTSPFGPLGYAKGVLMDIGIVMLDVYQFFVDKGVPPVIVGITMCIGGMVGR